MGTAKAEYMKLDERGMLGVTHMMMLDAKNLEIADLMIDWVGQNVPKAPRRKEPASIPRGARTEN